MNVLLILCLLLGIFVRRFITFPEQLVPCFNWWLISIALPCVILTLIPHTRFDSSSLFPVLSMWLVFLGALILAVVACRFAGWSREVCGVLILVAGIGNTSFMGYPIISGYYGADGLKTAVIADQLGSFIILSTAGVIVMALCSGHQVSVKQVTKRIITFPPFVALVASLLLKLTNGLPDVLQSPVASIGATMTPLALFTVGLQIQLRPPRRLFIPLLAGTIWKLLAAPVLVLFASLLFPVSTEVRNISVLQAGMAPMIAAAIMAQRAGLKPELATALQSYGILFSFVTIVGWHGVL
ncbi:hypothetical protein HA49_19540 [Tatumella morbirosei]|uniref:Transporter n=1 Tax=Tatumella morbirosei TaxID=642227 RepID=A0A095U7Y1_9GAMM|nr:AEC family transporter [Tatumella morbirosei]KGD70628.1 hypothetical protein HA49_19540 [Tatumella morbirosei]